MTERGSNTRGQSIIDGNCRNYPSQGSLGDFIYGTPYMTHAHGGEVDLVESVNAEYPKGVLNLRVPELVPFVGVGAPRLMDGP